MNNSILKQFRQSCKDPKRAQERIFSENISIGPRCGSLQVKKYGKGFIASLAKTFLHNFRELAEVGQDSIGNHLASDVGVGQTNALDQAGKLAGVSK